VNPPELSKSVVPPGGYTFDQALGDGSFTRIEGGSLDQISELILKYRQANGMLLPEGVQATPDAARADYNAQVCSKYPWLCTPQREPPPVTVEPGGAVGFEMLIYRMQRWIDRIRSHEQAWVDAKNASDRANVCLACPQNVLWQTNCDPCNSNLVQASAALRGARRLAQDHSLRGCRAFGTLQEVAVWLADPGGEAKYQPPPICWRL
jgi:hypothetical protein